MRKFFLFFLILLAKPGFSQNAPQADYIINNNGDSSFGEILDAGWNVNPETITFKQDLSKKTYSVSDLLGFAVHGEAVYLRRTVKYQLNPSNYKDAGTSYSNNEETRTAWLKIVVRGEYNLYELSTSKRKYYFVQKQQGEISELIFKVRFLEGQLIKDEIFKDQLLSFPGIAENKKLSRAIQNAAYSEKDLADIFVLLNNGNVSLLSSGHPKNEVDINLEANINVLSAGGQYEVYNNVGTLNLHTVKLNSSVGFRIGAAVNFVVKRNSATSIRAGIELGSIGIKATGGSNSNSGSFDREYYSGTLFFVKPSLAFNIPLNKDPLRTFFISPSIGYYVPINKNGIKGKFETGSSVHLDLKGIPSFSGAYEMGLGLFLKARQSKIGLHGYMFSNLIGSVNAKWSGFGIGLTYSYILTKRTK